jgi:AraC-like DNA-binding protein
MIERDAPSVLSSWARTIVDALSARDADVEVVLHGTDLTLDDFRDPAARHPIPATTRLWHAASKEARDPAFGLFASRHVRLTTFHALGYSVMASATLRDALERFVRYSHVLSDAAVLELDEQRTGTRLAIVIRPDSPPPADEAIDAVMSLIVRTCRLITDRRLSLRSAAMRRALPRDGVPYERFFRCPLEFGARSDALIFDTASLDLPLPMANPELARHNDEAVHHYLASVQVGTLIDRVRRALAERLPNGEPTADAVASTLGLSVRSLQRRLGELETSFATLLAETRRELACAHLREARYSVTEVAFLVGFEDVGAFARAFRRWTGMSPTDYRAREARALA